MWSGGGLAWYAAMGTGGDKAGPWVSSGYPHVASVVGVLEIRVCVAPRLPVFLFGESVSFLMFLIKQS